MRALLDTDASLWSIGDDARVSRRARAPIADRGNEIFFGAANGRETAVKARRDRLSLPAEPEPFVAEQLVSNAFAVLPLELTHALHVYSLPALRKDPFDRMLIALAQIEDLALLTADREIGRYAIKVIWQRTAPHPERARRWPLLPRFGKSSRDHYWRIEKCASALPSTASGARTRSIPAPCWFITSAISRA